MTYKKLFYFNCTLIFIYLSINSKIGFFFDGIPWNSKIENFVIILFIPFLFLLNKNFLKSKKIFYTLIFLILIKLTSSYLFVQNGLKFDTYSNLDKKTFLNIFSKFNDDGKRIPLNDKEKENKYQNLIKRINSKIGTEDYFDKINQHKTFDSFWHKENTYILKKHLKNKHMFPLDWARGIEDYEWKSLEIDFVLDGFAQLYEKETLIFVVDGVNFEKLKKIKKNRILFFDSNFNLDDIEKFIVDKNDFKEQIDIGDIEFSFLKDKNWSLQIYTYEDKSKKLKNAFQNRLSIEKQNYFNHDIFYIFSKNLLILTEIIFSLLLLLWFIVSIYKSLISIDRIIKLKFGVILTLLSFLLPLIIYFILIRIVFFKLNLNDGSYVSPLGLFYLIFIPTLYYFTSLKSPISFNSIKKIILIFMIFPGLLYFFVIFSYQVETVFNYPLSKGDDWGTIFNLVKIMTIYSDYIPARYCLHDMHNFLKYEFINYIKIPEVRNYFCEDNLGSIYHHNPLYRYFVAILLIMFGHGNFSIYILDVWCIMIAIIYTSAILHKTSLNTNYIYLLCISYFVINFVGPSRYLLGRGKEEFLGMIFLIIAAGFLYNCFNKRKVHYIYGLVSAIIALNIRLDKIFLVLSLISFYFEPVVGQLKNIYKKIYQIIVRNYTVIILYLSLVIFSLSSLYLRHYLILGDFYFVHPSSFEITVGTERDRIFSGLKSIYYVLSSADFWPDKPKFPSIVLFIGTFYLISLCFYRHESVKNVVPSSFTLWTLVILFSFFFFEPSAYPPRWSTHLLPLANLGFVYFVYNINKIIRN